MLVEKQRPLYVLNAAESKLIFACEDNNAILNNFKVHYEVLIEIKTFNNTLAAGSWAVEFSSRFKVQPNAEGVGIFDLSPVVKNYVSPDYNGGEVSAYFSSDFSTYKGTPYSINTPHPIHLIDKYTTTKNAVRFVEVTYFSYGATSQTAPVLLLDEESSHTSSNALFTIFNGYITRRDVLNLENYDYGYNFVDQANVITSTAGTAKFLTNAPTTQDVTVDDYMTLSFFGKMGGEASTDVHTGEKLTRIKVSMFNAAGSGLVSFYVDCTTANGGLPNFDNYMNGRIQYVGVGSANFKGWSSPWNSNIANTAYYTIRGYNASTAITQEYRFDIICEDVKGYESIRLTWLNKYGTWDYYTFTKKSTRSLSRQSNTYQQLAGTWNKAYYEQFGYDGGKKNFVVNTTESITVNTRFLTETEGLWFEELMNSPEVYILNGYQTDTSATVTNRYVEPVLLTNSGFVRKTKANDKLIQYTFDIERNTTNRTQAI